jgi:hypothetical protein
MDPLKNQWVIDQNPPFLLRNHRMNLQENTVGQHAAFAKQPSQRKIPRAAAKGKTKEGLLIQIRRLAT